MKKIKEFFNKRNQQLDKDGNEALDPKPMAIPIKMQKPLTLQDKIRQMIREEQSYVEQGYESFEDADDFDIGDDYDPSTPYEMDFDQENYDLSDYRSEFKEEQIDKVQSVTPDKPTNKVKEDLDE